MRTDGTFIGIEIDDAKAGDAEIAAKLGEVCPVDIFDGESGKVEIVEKNIDECVLCKLCMDATPDGTVKVLKLYDGEAVL